MKPTQDKKKPPALRQERDAAMLELGNLSIPAAADALGLSAARTYALAQAGKLTALKLGGTVYVTKASLDAYKASRKAPPGWILVSAATTLYHYGRSALLARAQRGEVGRELFAGRTYLRVKDLNAMAKVRAGHAGLGAL